MKILTLILITLLTSCSLIERAIDEQTPKQPVQLLPADQRAERLQRCIERFLRYGVKFETASKVCDERIYKETEI